MCQGNKCKHQDSEGVCSVQDEVSEGKQIVYHGPWRRCPVRQRMAEEKTRQIRLALIEEARQARANSPYVLR